MAAEGEDVKVRFGANIDDLKSKLDEVGGIFKQVGERFVVLAGVVAGGVLFKEFISAAVEANSEAKNLSRTLGITSDEAGVLAVALGDIGSSSEAYIGAFTKFSRQLRTNGDEIKAMGVDVDALKNGTKDSNQVFLESLEIVSRYAPGIDQTQASMKLFGKSVEEVQKLMKLNGLDMEEVRHKAESLNLTISQQGQESAKAYKHAMNDVHDVLTGFKKTVGEAVLPIFTEMANAFAAFGPAVIAYTKVAVDGFVASWQEVRAIVAVGLEEVKKLVQGLGELWQTFFGKDGPDSLQVFKNVLAGLHILVIGFRVAIQEAFLFVETTIKSAAAGFTFFGDLVSAVLNRDWDGVTRAWKKAADSRNQIMQDGFSKAADIARKGKEDIENAAIGATVKAPGLAPGGPAGGTGTKKFDTGEEQSHLASLRALHRAYAEAELALQQEFVKEEQAISDDEYKQELISTKKYYADKLELELSSIDMIIAARKKEAAEAQEAANVAGALGQTNEQRASLAEVAKLTGQIKVLEAQRTDAIRANAAAYREEERARQNALATIRAERDNSRVQDSVTQERARIEQMKALRQIDADQAFELQRQAEARSYAATEQFIAAKRALLREGDLQGQAQINAEAEAAERQHQARLLDISRASELQRAQISLQAQQSVQSGFADMLNSLMSGTTKLKDAVRQFAFNVTQQFQNLIAQRFAEKMFGAGTAGGSLIDSVTQPIMDGVDTIVRKWILGQTTMTAATEAGATTRVATEEGAASESLLIMAGSALKRIAIAAWVAAAEVYQAVAGIPYVGPFLAPAMAIAAGVAILGFAKNIASAEGGWWEIPSDQMAQVHKNEMVLPAREAQGVRDLVSGKKGGGMGGGGPSVQLVGVSAGDFFVASKADLQRVLNDMGRDFRK